MQIDFLDFHGKELSLKLRSDGNLGSLESSSGNLADMDCFEVSLTCLYGLVAFHLSGYSYYVLGIVHYNFGKIGFPENLYPNTRDINANNCISMAKIVSRSLFCIFISVS